MTKMYDYHKNTFEHIVERKANWHENLCTNLKRVRYNIGVQEDVHSQTCIDGGKPIAQFLNVITQII